MPSPGRADRTRHRGYAPLIDVWRGDVVESVHFGTIAAVDSTDRILGAAGDPATVTFLRSAAKPAQLIPLVESGAVERFGITTAEIAVMSGSHGGEPFHVEAVRSVLGKIGLDESALQCGVHPPSYRPAADHLRRAGGSPTALHNNCSGKHAGMLALAVHLGAPTRSYLETGHPVQLRIRAAVETLAGLELGGAQVAIDGCSAPNFAVPVAAAARIYARLLDPRGRAAGTSAASQVVEAMRRHPEMVAGTDRLCTALMQGAGHNMIAKIGAEGFFALGYDGGGRGVGVAIKISDGEGSRSRFTAGLEALRQLGALDDEQAAALRSRFVGDPHNHRGLVVGRIEPIFSLRSGRPAD